ncbi:MAG: enoyl-CoA hydratase/isomerase family protein [Solirubrobacterales bacterium]
MSDNVLNPPEMNTMELEIDDDIGILTLNRPDALNAMSPEMISEFPVIFAWLADRAPLRALVITGAGFAFCAGGDINWFKKGLDDPDIDIVAGVRAGADQLHVGIVEMQRIPYPIIAAVNGPAAGAGFSLALGCDIRISSDAAVFVCAYGRIGASPDGGMTYFLPRVVGPAKAVELLLTDPNLTAQDALEAGLVTEVVPADELLERAKDKARKLATKSPYYAKMAKELVHASLDNTLTEHLQLERHGIANSMGTEDLQGAVTAFLDGDKAEFKGK